MTIRCIGRFRFENGILCFDGKKTGSETRVFSATVCGKVVKGLKKLVCGRNNCVCESESGVSILNYEDKKMTPLSVGTVVHCVGVGGIDILSSSCRDGKFIAFPSAYLIVGEDGKMSRCKKPSTTPIEI